MKFLPSTLLIFLLMSACSTQKPMLDFSNDQGDPIWHIVNDGVMGGRSSCSLNYDEAGNALWKGMISLENNGGFSSIRSPLTDYKLAKYSGLKIRIKGDGRKYGFTLQTSRRWNGVSYFSYFKTKADEWTEIEVPFDSFEGTMLGTPLPSIPVLDPDRIKEIGVILYDKKAGSFTTEIDWVDVY